MTPRERYLRTLSFGEKPDRIFYAFSYPRKSTIEAWYLQGLPRMSDTGGDYGHPAEFDAFVGHDPIRGLSLKTDLYPAFEERIIEEKPGRRVWVDTLGITMVDAGKDLTTPGFRTRSYLAHPVTTREDWVRLRDERYNPRDPARYPADWAAQAAALKERDMPVMVGAAGLYWKARDWVGFENLSMMFYDNPSLVHEMMEYRAWFLMEVLDRALTDVQADCVLLSEDMGYKHALMISPQTFREFMMPRYKKMAEFFRSKGVPLLAVDSDGHCGQLIPLLIEAGFNCIQPMEIAAHNDPVAYRRQYGAQIAFWGGIDKREITTRERVYKEVMSKVPWLIEQGGYRPGVDHGIPPTCTLRGFLYMVELIKAIAEKRRVPLPDERLAVEDQLGPIQKMWSPELGIPDDEE